MSKSSVAVIDYGMGNLHSVASALEKVGWRKSHGHRLPRNNFKR